MQTKVTFAPHADAGRIAREIDADVVIVVTSENDKAPELELGRARRVDVKFDDVDEDDADCGRPISESDARRCADAIRGARRCVVTCRGGVSRSAAIAAAAEVAGVADVIRARAFGENAVGHFSCPNRLVFETVARELGLDVEARREETDALFERNVREHLAANL